MIKRMIGLVTVIGLIITFQTGVLAREFVINGGLDFSGTHEISGYGISQEDDTEIGLSVGFEYLDTLSGDIQWGVGGELGSPREMKDYSGAFMFIPIYGLLNIPLSTNGVQPYLTGRLGYNFFAGDDDYEGYFSLEGGLYYALGIGIKPTDNIRLQLLYSVNNGSGDGIVSIPGYGFAYVDGDVEYSKLSLIVGCSF